MTAGPEGAIWFTGQRAYTSTTSEAAVVGRVGLDGEVKMFDLPPRRQLGQIAAGPDENLWFAESYANTHGYLVGGIGHITPNGDFAEWELGNRGLIRSLAVGPDSGIWFTVTYWVAARRKAMVGRIDAAGELVRFPLPPRSGPGGIVAGSEGNLWFTERGAGAPKIGRITPGGRVTHFRLRGRGRVPTSIVAGTEGNLWFGGQTSTYSRSFGERLGRITPAGRITEYRAPGGGFTAALAPRPDGGVWYSSSLNPGPLGIGSVARDGAVARPSCLGPTCEIDADTLALGVDGSLWFAASKYYPPGGGGETGIADRLAEAAEAGLVGRFPPGATP